MSDLGTPAIGLDLGGTATKVGLFASDGALLERIDRPTPGAEETAGCAERALGALVDRIDGLLARHGMTAAQVGLIGIAVASTVTRAGDVGFSTNLNLDLDAYRHVFSQHFPSSEPVFVNDADAAALGAYWHDGHARVENLLFITLGTGVGGGIVVDGKPMTGSAGAVGEVGHICIDPTERARCGCGRRGCLEQYASAPALVRFARAALDAAPPKRSTLAGRPFQAKDVFDAARAGDTAANEAVGAFSRALAFGLAQLTCVLDPDLIVVGGGISGSSDVWLDRVRMQYRDDAFPPCRDIPIRVCSLGNSAGIHGAVLFAHQKHEETLR